MLKVDLHLHSSEDPIDILDYDARDLIRRAAELKFDVIALTLHGKVIDVDGLEDFARGQGVLFIRGIEKRIHGREVLIYNVTQQETDAMRTFTDLRELRRQKGGDILVVAPHPYFKKPQCLGRHLEENIDLFDAIEQCHLYTRFWDMNRRAARVARAHGKPMLATSDSHALWMFGKSFTLLDGEKTREGVFRAVREGRAEAHSQPCSVAEFARKLAWFLAVHDLRRLRRWVRRTAARLLAHPWAKTTPTEKNPLGNAASA